MYFYNFPFLNKNDIDAIKTALAEHAFVDGKETAEGAAKDKKSNAQLELNSGVTHALYGAILKLIFDHAAMRSMIFPKRVPRIFINRYGIGSHYGWHVDSSIINRERTDFSFTIWLSDPNEYEGGELQVRLEDDSIRSFKYDAGHIFLYPTGELHRVTEVTSGERQAIVGWITSAVASEGDRIILQNYRKAIKAVGEQSISSEAQDLLDSVYQLLVRRFSS